MNIFKLSVLILFTGLSTGTPYSPESTKALQKRAPCTVFSNNDPTLDDAPLINAALTACGNSGTVILSASQTFTLHTPLQFEPCNHCDFQIEGSINITTAAVTAYKSTFNLTGVQGATIRSLTAQGLLDGNAVSYWYSRWDSGTWSGDPFFELANSSSITISNLSIRNVKQRFFRATNASNLSFSKLNLSVDGQWGEYPRNEAETIGFEFGYVNNISIANIDMAFRARPNHRGPTGICAAFDTGSQNIFVRDISCTGAWGGILVMIYTLGPDFKPPPSLAPPPISNITVQNLTFNGTIATGFKNYWSDLPMKNITWDGVEVLGGTPATVDVCYLRSHSVTAWVNQCRQQVNASFEDAWFRGYRGDLKDAVGPSVYANNISHVDVHAEGWANTIALLMKTGD
ncbi:pectin lyase-like protein [Delitschia confertaspora ATCC 74209]|uniref:Pectin lyase-like protein n=1 Tax=Delitschia confertaspora ATCC 74209 TaxID=1513339 RepID=A0A9P4N0F9_9PLEO|nr:pectin lyase-like protein [Delitschia confertaspora ATCC 74209]